MTDKLLYIDTFLQAAPDRDIRPGRVVVEKTYLTGLLTQVQSGGVTHVTHKYQTSYTRAYGEVLDLCVTCVTPGLGAAD